MLSSIKRRAGVALTIGAVAASTVLVAPAPQALAATSPAGDGAGWLVSELTNGIVHNDQYNFDDYGTSIDFAIALDAVGGHDSDVAAIADAVGPHLVGSAGYTESDEYDFVAPYDFKQRGLYANATAKAAAFATVAGIDPTNYAGVNLIERLEARVVAGGDRLGRIADDSFYGDYGNTIGQAFAVKALSEADSTKAADAEGWLLAQQCPGGGFALNMGGTTTTCAADSDADPDVTAYVLILLGDRTETQWTTAIDNAVAWLEGRQNLDGSFNGGASTDYPNSNSTGLAGWALGQQDEAAAAAKAAVWLRAHQAQATGACTSKLSADIGAIGYDDKAVAAGKSAGISTTAQSYWRLGTAQAAPAMKYYTQTSAPALAVLPRFVKAGTRLAVKGTGLAQGDWICGALGASRATSVVGSNRTASLTLTVPAGTAVRTVRLVTGHGNSATRQFTSLAAKRLPIAKRSARVRMGRLQTVKVKGLVAGEKVVVRYAGRVISRGRANARGVFAKTFRVRGAVGLKRVAAQGQFGTRRGTTTFRVVR